MDSAWLRLGVAGSTPASAQETTIKVGMARSTSNSAELMAINKGYFKQFGIKLEIEDIESSANVIALLAQGRLNMVAGGISAGYFNAIEKNLPITIVADRVSTPIRHNLMIRPDLKDQIKSFKDLKGKVIASNGHRFGLDLRDRQDAGARRPDHRRRRDQGHPVPADVGGLHQQGDRRRHCHPAVRLGVRGSEHRGEVRRGRRPD